MRASRAHRLTVLQTKNTRVRAGERFGARQENSNALSPLLDLLVFACF